MNFSYLNPPNSHAYIRSIFRFRLPLFVISAIGLFSYLYFFIKDKETPQTETQLGTLLIIAIWLYGVVGYSKTGKKICSKCGKPCWKPQKTFGEPVPLLFNEFYRYGVCMHCGACDIQYPKK
jgi:ribosomal protein L40E